MSVAVDKPKNRTADSLFPPDKYVNKPGVVVFAEHRTQLRDGTPVTYDREVLEKIAANCNRRIEETGNYAAVCIGHTDRDSGDKPLVGFAGPFRVEERDGRAVIVADFHIFQEAVDQLRHFPRPSPEVWIPRDGFDPERIFLDPIAMLGAETPRLDLGMTFLYHARAGAMICEKYAAAMPAAGNVAFPEFGSQNKVDYTMPANLTPEDIQAILKAIESTDWYKWIRQQMAASQKPGEGQPEPDNQGPPAEDQAKKEPYAKDDQGEPIPDKPKSEPEHRQPVSESLPRGRPGGLAALGQEGASQQVGTVSAHAGEVVLQKSRGHGGGGSQTDCGSDGNSLGPTQRRMFLRSLGLRWQWVGGHTGPPKKVSRSMWQSRSGF